MEQFAVSQKSVPKQQSANNAGDDRDDNDDDNNETPSTPVSAKRKRSRATLKTFTPRSSSRAHDASRLFRVKFATSNPFAYNTDAQDLAWKAYAEARPPPAVDEPAQDILLIKMKKDVQFAKENLQVVCNIYIYAIIDTYYYHRFCEELHSSVENSRIRLELLL